MYGKVSNFTGVAVSVWLLSNDLSHLRTLLMTFAQIKRDSRFPWKREQLPRVGNNLTVPVIYDESCGYKATWRRWRKVLERWNFSTIHLREEKCETWIYKHTRFWFMNKNIHLSVRILIINSGPFHRFTLNSVRNRYTGLEMIMQRHVSLIPGFSNSSIVSRQMFQRE